MISPDIDQPEECLRPDVLVRGLPDTVLAAIDAHAARLGISRSDYVRRRLTQDAQRTVTPVSVEDLVRFAQSFTDLANDDVMRRAWE